MQMNKLLNYKVKSLCESASDHTSTFFCVCCCMGILLEELMNYMLIPSWNLTKLIFQKKKNLRKLHIMHGVESCKKKHGVKKTKFHINLSMKRVSSLPQSSSPALYFLAKGVFIPIFWIDTHKHYEECHIYYEKGILMDLNNFWAHGPFSNMLRLHYRIYCLEGINST